MCQYLKGGNVPKVKRASVTNASDTVGVTRLANTVAKTRIFFCISFVLLYLSQSLYVNSVSPEQQ